MWFLGVQNALKHVCKARDPAAEGRLVLPHIEVCTER